MGVVKVFLKVTLLIVVLGALAAVVSVRRTSNATPVSYDAWPEVPEKSEP